MVGLVPRVFGGRLDGEVRVAELDPRRAPAHELARRIGLVLENYSAQLTQVRVRDEVAASLHNLGLDADEAAARAGELLDRLGLGELAGTTKRTWELSGGQQQRLVAAAALATDPDVLVLDTVTSMLDPSGKAEMRKVVQDMRNGRALVNIVDRVVLLSGGRIVADGSAREILTDVDLLGSAGLDPPAVPRTARVLGLGGRPLTLDELDAELALNGAGAGRRAATRAGGGRRRPTGEPVVEVRGAGDRYRDGTEALRGADLTIARGEVHGLIGGNGAGKTTLAKMVNGLVRPTSGSVRVAGRDVRSMRAVDVAELVGTALQSPDEHFTERTVQAELEAPLRWRRYRRRGLFGREQRFSDDEIVRRAAAAAELTGLDAPTLAADPMDLPFGLRKLISIAAATVLEPQVVLLHEPGTGLDGRAVRLDPAVLLDADRGARRRAERVAVPTHCGVHRRLCLRAALHQHR